MTLDPERLIRRAAWTRRGFLRVAALGAAGTALGACAPAAAPAKPPAQPTAPAKPAVAAATAAPARAAWEQEWERVLAAARQEGVVVVAGPPGDLYRQALVAFEKTYPDIKVEYTGASGRDFGPK